MELTVQVAKYIRDLIEAATDDELLEIISECDGLSQTNCDWLRYELRNAIHDVATNEIQLRLDAK